MITITQNIRQSVKESIQIIVLTFVKTQQID